MPIDPDVILGQSHDLEHEFPEFVDTLHDLQDTDTDFKTLCDHYYDVNREIIRIEQCVEARSHQFFEGLKRQRLRYKDEVYTILRHATAH